MTPRLYSTLLGNDGIIRWGRLSNDVKNAVMKPFLGVGFPARSELSISSEVLMDYRHPPAPCGQGMLLSGS
jgi:hypothetical protein